MIYKLPFLIPSYFCFNQTLAYCWLRQMSYLVYCQLFPCLSFPQTFSSLFPSSHTTAYQEALVEILFHCPWKVLEAQNSTLRIVSKSLLHYIGLAPKTSSQVCLFQQWQRRGKWRQNQHLIGSGHPKPFVQLVGSTVWEAASLLVAEVFQWRQPIDWYKLGKLYSIQAYVLISKGIKHLRKLSTIIKSFDEVEDLFHWGCLT